MRTRNRLSRFVTHVREPVSASGPEEIARYLTKSLYSPMEAFEQEEFWVLILSARHTITHTALVSRGTIDVAIARPSDVYREAVRLNARFIVVAHNHPSGDPEPSSADVEVTRRLVEAGQIIDIQLMDHVIVATGGWYSIRREQPDIW